MLTEFDRALHYSVWHKYYRSHIPVIFIAESYRGCDRIKNERTSCGGVKYLQCSASKLFSCTRNYWNLKPRLSTHRK